jgi:hypothetical protein
MLRHKNLVCYYPCEGNANEATGQGTNGTVTNATLSTGNSGQCYSFNGSTTYISTGTAQSRLFSGSYHTITAWVYHDRSASLADNGVAQFTNTSAPYAGYEMYIRKSDGVIGRYNATTFVYSSVIVPNLTWTFVALCCYKDATNGYAKASINGNNWTTFITGNTATMLGISTSTAGSIGRYVGSSHYFKGLIDEVAFWDIELNPQDLKRVMLGMAPLR